ncbi:MAG: glycosyltransferase family 2 protein, partial [Gammaproteobacteria bacterium]|nr:glycosyltransferase family 2 protein [Gammaproteobacteria bacterium]
MHREENKDHGAAAQTGRSPEAEPRADAGEGSAASADGCELSIVMPCLNEAATLQTCIDKARAFLERSGISGEIIVSDNGSDDGSQDIAVRAGARLVHSPAYGYGAGLMAGIEAARGRYVIMGDSDDSYDFANLDAYVEKLREGYELVMGNRFRGGIKPGAMPGLHRYLGNPLLSFAGRLFFGGSVGDFNCGMRGLNRAAILGLQLQTTGMEFAAEMVVRAQLMKLRITEVPTTLSPDGRDRPPHLRSWSDGWRVLRFLLLFAPRWLFLYPGLALTLFGALVMVLLMPGPLIVGSVSFDLHTMTVGLGAVLVGTQTVAFFILAKQFAVSEKLLPASANFDLLRRQITLERLVVIGAGLMLLGLAGIVWAFLIWGGTSFEELDYT